GTQIATPVRNATAYSDSANLSPDTQYFYRILATNAGGDSDYSTADAKTDVLVRPTAPSGLAASAASSSQINLTWTDASNNETGFLIERSPDGTNGWSQIATPAANATSYSDTGRSPATTYYYR